MDCQSDSLGLDRTGSLIVGALDTWAHGLSRGWPVIANHHLGHPASCCVTKISSKAPPIPCRCEEAR